MNEAVDCCCCRHRIFEDPVPLRKDKVACDHDASTLIPFREEGEKHFHFLAVLLNVSEIIECHDIEGVETF